MAIAITAEDIAGLAPEFASLEDSDVEPFVELAREFVCEGKWGTEKKAKHALILMTAHLMKDVGLGIDGEATDSNVSGPVTSERVGDLQRSYATFSLQGGNASEQLLVSTKYGKMFLALRKTLVFTPLVL